MGWILPLILGLSLLLRLSLLDRVPPELFGDELDIGYQAYSLLTTGRDLYNQALPVLIHSLSEWRLPVIVYYTVPSVASLGLTEAGVRLPEAVMGGLGSVIISILTFQTTRRRSAALTAGLLLALIPWHFLYSRMAAFGAVTLLNFVMLGTIFYLARRQFLSAVFFGLSLYVYGSALLFVPLWLAGLRLISPRPVIKLGGILFLLALPLIYLSVFGPASGRFNQLGVFSAPEVLEEITSYRARHPGVIGRVFSNRPLVLIRLISANYLQVFSPEFLFIRGDPAGRHSLQIVGGLYPVLAPFLIWGVIDLVRRKQFISLIWLILAPLPSALTQGGGYHATRLFLMVAPLVIVIACGLVAAWNTLHRFTRGRVVLLSFSLVAVFSLLRTGYYYFSDYPALSWRWWQMGYKSSLTALSRLEPGYSRVFINNTYEPSLIRFLFWTRYSPSDFHASFTLDQPLPEIAPGYDGFSLGQKYYFGAFSDSVRRDGIADNLLPGALYLISQRDDVGGDWDWRRSPPPGVQVLHTSLDPSGSPLFYLISRQ